MAMKKKKTSSKSEITNAGNNQQGRQQGHNTGQVAWKSNIKPQTRNDPGAPKTTGPEKKEQKENFKKVRDSRKKN